MILKIRQAGEACLRTPATALTTDQLANPDIQRLIDDMAETLRDHPGVGLAAPQVGVNLRLIIIEDLAKYHKKIPPRLLKEQDRKPVKLEVIINPTLHVADETVRHYFEGCLSVAGYRAIVARADKVNVVGLDRHGKPLTIAASGWHARILQHEVEHLDGHLYVQRMAPKSFMSEKSFLTDWAEKGTADLKQSGLI